MYEYVDTGRTCKLHAERPRLDSNSSNFLAMRQQCCPCTRVPLCFTR
uniref:Uncharacterized protein n=1 Tax=Anguilla anguilla TaxID=7936 RepID=A0A0E9TJL9_ANGAN